MADEKDKKFIVPEGERTYTVTFERADSLSLDLEALDEGIKSKHDEITTLQYELNVVQGQASQLTGRYSEQFAKFWLDARKDPATKAWVEMVRAKGWSVKIKRNKAEGENADITLVQLVAYNPADEQMQQIRRMMFERNSPDGENSDA